MALSHNDWELPKTPIWLAEIIVEMDLDFPDYILRWKSCKPIHKILTIFFEQYLFMDNIYLWEKIYREDEQILALMSRTARKYYLISTSYVKY